MGWEEEGVVGGGGGRGGRADRKGHQVKGNFGFLNIQKSANPLSGTVPIQNHYPE